jgi:ubiquinone/menaquinone biosynthesis C-methylase UbiE
LQQDTGVVEANYEKRMMDDRQQFVIMADLKDSSRVLDAGTGHGFFSVCIARRVESSGLLVAVDVSSEHVRQANALLKKEKLGFTHVIRADLRSVPIANNSLNTMMSYNLLCSANHPSALPRIFSEAKRILRKDGTMTLVDYVPEPQNAYERLFYLGFSIFKKVYAATGDTLHLAFFESKKIESMLKKLGFCVEIEVIERDISMSKSAPGKKCGN